MRFRTLRYRMNQLATRKGLHAYFQRVLRRVLKLSDRKLFVLLGAPLMSWRPPQKDPRVRFNGDYLLLETDLAAQGGAVDPYTTRHILGLQIADHLCRSPGPNMVFKFTDPEKPGLRKCGR